MSSNFKIYTTLFITIVFLCTSAIMIPQPLWQIDQNTPVHFTVKGLFGKKVQGALYIGSSIIDFDTNNLESSHIYVSIPVASIQTGNKMRDKHLLKKDFFAADSFPIITFTSISFSKGTDQEYRVKGNLSLKNITKEVTIPFTYTQNNDKGEFVGDFKINRMDFGIGTSYKRTIGKEVLIDLKIPVTFR